MPTPFLTLVSHVKQKLRPDGRAGLWQRTQVAQRGRCTAAVHAHHLKHTGERDRSWTMAMRSIGTHPTDSGTIFANSVHRTHAVRCNVNCCKLPAPASTMIPPTSRVWM